MSLIISTLALVGASLRLNHVRFTAFRIFLVFFALANGQIHIAALSLFILILMESNFQIPKGIALRYILGMVFIMGTIIVPLPFAQIQTSRTISELIQVFFYLYIFFVLMCYFEYNDINLLIKGIALSSFATAVLCLVLLQLNMVTTPHVFLARGGNEGSFYLLIMGVVPAGFLFIRSRNWMYLAFIFTIIVVQYTATSRANTGLSVLVLGCLLYAATPFKLLRALYLLVVLAVVLVSLPIVFSFLQGTSNTSLLERMSLYTLGFSLWQEYPVFGWGYGAASELVPQSEVVDGIYPHFHSTYVQILVEQGVFGILLILFFIAIWARNVFYSFFRVTDSSIAFFLFTSTMCLAGSSFFEAIHFGADRALPMVLITALQVYFIHDVSRSRSARGLQHKQMVPEPQ